MKKKTRAERMGGHLMHEAPRKEVREGIEEFTTLDDWRDYIIGVKTAEEEMIKEGKLTDANRESKYLEDWLSQELLKQRRRKDLEKRAAQK